jgi:hypothetical protein
MGFSVLPVGKDKRPALRSWKTYMNRRPSSSEISHWFQQNPDAGVAIVTGAVSKVVVLDEDVPGALNAYLASIGERFPVTPIAITGRGGKHLYFQHPGAEVRNFARRIPDIDFRGDGGYVVAPPSVHPSGRQYKWLLSIFEFPLAPVPGWLMKLLTPEEPSPKSSRPRGRPHVGGAAVGTISPEKAAELLDSVTGEYIRGLIVNGDKPKRYNSRSEAAFAVISRLLELGMADEDICALVLYQEHAIGARYRERRRPEAAILQEIRRIRVRNAVAEDVRTRSIEDAANRPNRPSSDTQNDPWVLDRQCRERTSLLYRERTLLGIELLCKDLSCPYCGPRYRYGLECRISYHVRERDCLYLTFVPMESWDTFSRALRRGMEKAAGGASNAGYVRFADRATPIGDIFRVYSTAPHDLRQASWQPVRLPIDKALGNIKVEIHTLKSKRNYHTSHSWGDARDKEGWIILGTVGKGIAEVQAKVAESGFHTKSIRPLVERHFESARFVGDYASEVSNEQFETVVHQVFRGLR